jgi:beta-xylosidase
MMSIHVIKRLLVAAFIYLSAAAYGQGVTDAGNGNPVIPGYFADPTVKKFGDTFYIYATTDGNGGGFGPSQVWMSKDFVNWSFQDMNWPTTHHYWAPDVTKGNDGKYYMYYCQPVEIFGASSASPVGPWTSLLPARVPIVKNFLVPNVITLDGQTFRDDDGKFYMYWGTWGIYPNHGCGVGLMNPDMKSFDKLAQIPNTVAKDFFEAPFMFKRNGIYYLTYSSGRCEDDTYRVQYAISKTGPMGPFEYGKNNPILVTSADGTVHGPGHQSVLQEGNETYLIYHRHNNPHSGGGYHRQVAADKMTFDAAGNIEKIVPSHKGIGFLARNVNPSLNLALGSSLKASSFYSDDFKPEFAVDDNNGTLWKPGNNTADSWLELDLGSLKSIASIHTQFEYATWYYQYLYEYSADGKTWKIFSDQRKNTTHGSPMIDVAKVKARFIRLTISNTEYPGLNKAVWNIKIYSDDRYHPKMAVLPKDPALIPDIRPLGKLIDIDASAFELGSPVKNWENKGALGGSFDCETATVPVVDMIGGKKAVLFPGKSFFEANFKAPASLSGNSSFSVSMWVYNPAIAEEEPVLSWTNRGGIDMTNATIGYGSHKNWGAAAHWGWADMAYKKLPPAGSWHHIAVVFDGTNEKIFVDGVLDKIELKMLFLANLRNFMLGTTEDQNAYFSGALASLKVYDVPLSNAEVEAQASGGTNTDVALYLDAAKLPYGKLERWKNEGYAAGMLQSSGTVSVADLAGKIAVKLSPDALLKADPKWNTNFKTGQPYTLVAQVLREKERGWSQVIISSDGQHERYYLNGTAVPTSPFPELTIAAGVLQIAGGKVKGLGGLTGYDHHVDATKAAVLYAQWLKTLSPAPVGIAFAQLPQARSTALVRMSATRPTLPGSILEYYFSETTGNPGAKNSGWVYALDYDNFGLKPGQTYSYTLKARDNYGNVTSASPAVKVKTDPALFRIAAEEFAGDQDFKKSKGNFWDGLIGQADTASSFDGTLLLSSQDTKWDGGAPKGPFLYKNVSGDFIVQVQVTDVSGLKTRKANGANDAGLMVLDATGPLKLVQNSIFPGWSVGNMVTSLNDRGRLQSNNASGWNFYPYLQIQRIGSTFFLRGSFDAADWKELPGSPVVRADIGQQVQVGLFHATYGEQKGFGRFDHFQLIQLKP